jgi:crossover junction endodeoxyribonuclease RuvC
MIVLGIDPGIARAGYGVVEAGAAGTRAVAFGCIRTKSSMPGPARLRKIYVEVTALFGTYAPDCLVLEKLFFSRNITSALSVAEVRGVILLAAEEHGVPVAEYTPNQVKQAITGSGRADKHQMQEMIRRLLHLDAVPSPDDAADGLSIALCHIHCMR